jgi:hypothetical protein
LQATGQDVAADLAELLGSIKPAEVVGIMVAYAAAWMSGAFEGKMGGDLLEGREEVKIVRRENF